MLLPDNIHPELCIYYNGFVILKELKILNKQKVFDLYGKIKNKNGISFPTFILCLDWLYLIELAEVNEGGWIELCS